MKLANWLGHTFQSSAFVTDEWKAFFRDYKSALKEIIGQEWTIADITRGHFYVSGFLKNNQSGKVVYFSTNDVRGSNDGWCFDILIRTAKDIKDYTGGANQFTQLARLKDDINTLIA